MKRFPLLLFVVGILFGGYVLEAEPSLPTGTREFEFTSPRSGQRIQVFYVKPDSYDPALPPVVVLHGRGRNADEYRDGWIELAEQYHFLVVAPLFPEAIFSRSSGYNLGNVFVSEKDLTPNPRDQWSFWMPDDVFDYLKNAGETSARGYFAFGHSAGSQFLHRKVALAPDPQMLLAVAANAGWYTLPDLDTDWPYGFRKTGLTEEEVRNYLQAPLVILLGDRDIDPEDPGVRHTKMAQKQGSYRYARGHYFYDYGKTLAGEMEVPFDWKLVEVPGVGHEGNLMAPFAAACMEQMMGPHRQAGSLWTQGLALLVIGATVWLVIRGYQTQATLFLSGIVMLLTSFLVFRIAGERLPGYGESLTGWIGFDPFAIIKESFSTRVGRIGLIVMAAGGFARYMNSISASTALVRVAVGFLSHVKSPYLLLAIAYVVGQLLNIFIPSAAGLAMLLLVALYPTLVKLGLSPVSVAAVIGTTASLDLGPASGASNVAANIVGLEPAVYFVRYQLPIAMVVIPVVAILHFAWQRYLDRKSFDQIETPTPTEPEDEDGKKAPLFYALLPLTPLVLLLVFSPLLVTSIQLDVVTAMLIGLFLGMLCEGIRLRSLKQSLAGITPFFQGMGDIFAKVVTLIVAAETFAAGIKASGLIDSMVRLVQENGLGSVTMMIVLVLLIGFTAIVTGSGNAALFSFANLISGIARPMGISTVSLMLPSQLTSSLFRSMSPVAGVIIAVSSTANVSPFAVVRRTSVPMIGGVIATLGMHCILF